MLEMVSSDGVLESQPPASDEFQEMTDQPIIHIIEDDPAVRESLGMLLKTAGLQSRLYASAPEFLETNPAPAGCVVTDIRMPQMTGIELLEELRNLAADGRLSS